MLADPKVRRAFEVENADADTVERYGRNKFGLSLLMGSRLLEAESPLSRSTLARTLHGTRTAETSSTSSETCFPTSTNASLRCWTISNVKADWTRRSYS